MQPRTLNFKTYFFSILLILTFQLGCNSKSDSHPADMPPPPADSDKEKKHKEEHADLKCPWNLYSHPTYSKFKIINIEINVNCAELRGNDSWSFQYTEDDFNKAIQFIDVAYDIFKNAEVKPTQIRLGSRSYHDSKANVLQIQLGDNELTNPENHYIESTLLLMSFENKEFENQIRFNYGEIQKLKGTDGKKIDFGAAFMFAPPPDIVKADMQYLLKFKKQILAHKDFFPDVVLFHGNKLSYYELNDWNEFYFFTPEAGDELNTEFFKYLRKYVDLRQSTLPLDLGIYVSRYWIHSSYDSYFEKANQILELISKLAPSLKSYNIQSLHVFANSSNSRPTEQNYLQISYNSRILTLEKLYTYFEKMYDFEKIKACIEKQNFNKESFSVKCPIE